uniref:Uncharacterized protein n=1 Tax=Timema bartmani TaxID=61472 RepID=A0A7R9HY74_9NEOP|nr:unnamed protein product [Timema bartmani]
MAAIILLRKKVPSLASLTNPYTEWIMMPNDKGEPTLAILDGPQINARANTLHKFKIYMFTKGNKEGIEISLLNDDELREAGFKPEVPTKVLTHGFSSTIHHPAVQDVKDGKQENRNRLF